MALILINHESAISDAYLLTRDPGGCRAPENPVTNPVLAVTFLALASSRVQSSKPFMNREPSFLSSTSPSLPSLISPSNLQTMKLFHILVSLIVYGFLACCSGAREPGVRHRRDKEEDPSFLLPENPLLNSSSLHHPRIINGDAAALGAYPFYTSVWGNSSSVCGAVLINSDILRTLVSLGV
jgi:hypothetical protein